MDSSKILTTSLAPIGRFIRHFLEMCVVMCVGAVTLNVLIWGGAALLGYTDLTQRFPVLSALVVTATLSLPMAVWMRFRGHERGHIVEMVVPTVVTGLLVIGGYWLGIVSQRGLIESQVGLACPVMAVVMLLRFGFYSQGHTAHHAAQPHHAA
jgi:hypothetical protein